MKITEDELESRIRLYLARTDVRKYDFEKVGRYKIISGGQGDYGTTEILDVIEGRYIDALVCAVQQDNFCGFWCSWDSGPNNGRVEFVRENPVDKGLGNSLLKKLKGGKKK